MEELCRKIFTTGGSGAALQDAVFAEFPQGDCEDCSVSEHSPGPVLNDETLTRLIVDPIHLDHGKVSPAAFMDAYTLDLSLFREELATDEEIQLAINQIKEIGQQKDPIESRQIVAVMQASAGVIRQLRLEEPDERMCMVYDTGDHEKPAHASAFTPSRARQNRKDQRAIRRALLAAFGEPKTMVEYRDSLQP